LIIRHYEYLANNNKPLPYDAGEDIIEEMAGVFLLRGEIT